MRLLLDTHAFIWWAAENSRLSPSAQALIADGDNQVFISAASAWEIATKVRAGRWVEAAGVAERMPEVIAAEGFEPLSVTLEHGRRAGFLEGDHRDPFDRILAAQAMLDDMTLVTADPAFTAFEVKVVW
ncbi:type II toxin-antitoxin system VapC family toxin [Terrarubrum flagellatum]|uniref:type II toxin-antitoxin system VapC family toxin n=1 Tax=Terrirubrum flagellatum TaxID=2895980 RepID=UPI003145240F